MNAARLLKRDHRNVEALFDEYRFAPPDSKRTILENITCELTKHMLAEEGVLYPALGTFVPDGEILMEDAVEEHKEAKGLLAELENAEAGSFEMDSKVATLRRAIDHHVRREEGEIFPKLEQMLGATQLEELGAEIESAKQSAPIRPPASAIEDSPGTSVAGMATAAVDRLKNAVSGKD